MTATDNFMPPSTAGCDHHLVLLAEQWLTCFNVSDIEILTYKVRLLPEPKLRRSNPGLASYETQYEPVSHMSAARPYATNSACFSSVRLAAPAITSRIVAERISGSSSSEP